MRVEEGVDTNGPTEAVILWSVSEGVVDVADELCDFSSSTSASDSSFADPAEILGLEMVCARSGVVASHRLPVGFLHANQLGQRRARHGNNTSLRVNVGRWVVEGP